MKSHNLFRRILPKSFKLIFSIVILLSVSSSIEDARKEFNCFGELPIELQGVILSYCDWEVVLRAREASREMKHVADDHTTWQGIAKNYKIPLDTDNIGSPKNQFLTAIRLEEAKKHWGVYRALSAEAGNLDARKGRLKSLRAAVNGFNFAASHGCSEAASMLEEIYDTFSDKSKESYDPIDDKSDEEIGNIILYQIPPTLDLEVFPIYSADRLMQLPDQEFFKILSKTFIEHCEWPKNLCDRYCSILVAMGHPLLADFAHESNRIFSSESTFYDRTLKALWLQYGPSLATEELQQRIERGVRKSLEEADLDQLDLWLAYKLIRVNLQVWANEELDKNLDLINPANYFPKEISLSEFYTLPVSSAFYFDINFGFSEKYLNDSLIGNSCFKNYHLACKGGIKNLMMLIRKPHGGDNKLGGYIFNLWTRVQLENPSLFFVGSEILGKHEIFSPHFFSRHPNPFERQLIKQAHHLLETGCDQFIPVNLLTYLTLEPSHINCFYIRHPEDVSQRLLKLREIIQTQNDYDLSDDLLFSHAIMILLYKANHKKDALEELSLSMEKYFRGGSMSREARKQIYRGEFVAMSHTILEIALDFREFNIVEDVLNEVTLLGFNYDINYTFTERYRQIRAEHYNQP